MAYESKQGINGRSLNPISTVQGQLGAPLFALHVRSTVSSGTGTTNIIFDNNCPFRLTVVGLTGNVNEAGNTDAETVKLTDGSDDICEAVALQGLGDTDTFRATEIDDAFSTIEKGGSLKVVTAATTHEIKMDVYVLCVRA